MKITLRKDNVVKEVDSEDMAAALEAKGFLRDGAEKEAAGGTAEELRRQLLKASESISDEKERREAAEREMRRAGEQLAEAKEDLLAAEKRIAELTRELAGTREQLEAAVKKNTEAAGKKTTEAAEKKESGKK